jgi:hypothetical protein
MIIYKKSDNGKIYKFHNAISTYLDKCFSIEQIDTAGTNNELAAKEIKYISNTALLKTGYNSDKGGGFKKKQCINII